MTGPAGDPMNKQPETLELARILAAAETLSTAAHHRLAQAEGSTVPCPFPDCVISAAEHHRLAYGFLAENRELKRRIEALEHGAAAPLTEETA